MKVAELWAKRVIAGDKPYADIPAKLKTEVDNLLDKAGYKPPKKALKKS